MPGDRLRRILGELAGGESTWHAARLCAVGPAFTGVNGLGIMLMSGDVPRGSLCTSDDVSQLIEELQYTLGQGPCIDAYQHDAVVTEPDLADPETPRWFAFSPPVLRAGVRAVFGFPLRVGTVRLGALNLYARLPGAYGLIDRTKAVIFAAHAGIALGTAEALEDAAVSLQGEVDLLQNLREALASREVIGQAEGILMERERITSDQAFGVLRQASQHLNIKLREIAQYVVDTGEVPSST